MNKDRIPSSWHVVVVPGVRALMSKYEWQDIATAPEGVSVLLCWHDGIAAPMFAVGFNLGSGRRWQTTHEWLHNAQSWPTHWVPLPAPPERKAEK